MKVLRTFLFMFALMFCCANVPANTTQTLEQSLKIAFLDAPSSTLNMNAFDMQILKEYLMNRPDVFDALKAKGYKDIEIISVNEQDHMMRLLRFAGAEIVFTPLSLYLNSLPVKYTPVFQLYEGSYMDQRLVIFKNPNMNSDATSSSTKVAVSFADMKSQPQLLNAIKSSIKNDRIEFAYYSNPHDIAKSVLCGLIEYGICERKILDTVIQQAWVDMSQKDVVTIIDELDLMPTDPVLFRSEFNNPDYHILAIRLRRAFSQYFATQPSSMVLIPLDTADVQDKILKYKDQVLKLFQKALLTTSSRQIISEFDNTEKE